MIKFKNILINQSFKTDHNGHDCTFIKCIPENIDDCHPINCLAIHGECQGKLCFINDDADCFMETVS